MSIPSKQTGWSQEANLYWEIAKKLDRLIASLGTNGNHYPPSELPYTCDSTIITCDNGESLTVNGVATTIRNEFDLANQKMTLLYNNI